MQKLYDKPFMNQKIFLGSSTIKKGVSRSLEEVFTFEMNCVLTLFQFQFIVYIKTSFAVSSPQYGQSVYM